ncbi:hypothetical protein [Methylobacterium iners]|uniref:hypothetical protein n=1 Tax=Methylobacterium iners TaxID=418707 RepID=UPI001EE37B9A|nr:hypothetical protein [Methylobacterium iners]
MNKAEQLQEILTSLSKLVDPYQVGEPITLRLQHDSGMRLLDSLPADEVRAAFAEGLRRDFDGSPLYEAQICGVTIQWPSRRVDLGGGKVDYI